MAQTGSRIIQSSTVLAWLLWGSARGRAFSRRRLAAYSMALWAARRAWPCAERARLAAELRIPSWTTVRPRKASNPRSPEATTKAIPFFMPHRSYDIVSSEKATEIMGNTGGLPRDLRIFGVLCGPSWGGGLEFPYGGCYPRGIRQARRVGERRRPARGLGRGPFGPSRDSRGRGGSFLRLPRAVSDRSLWSGVRCRSR